MTCSASRPQGLPNTALYLISLIRKSTHKHIGDVLIRRFAQKQASKSEVKAMPEWQPIETAPTNGRPNPAALLSAMQILPLADACALVAMSPEHRAAFMGEEACKVESPDAEERLCICRD